MKLIKSFIVLVAIALFGGVFYYYLPTDPCEDVLKYSVGRFDQNFGVSKSDFISHIKEAEALWEDTLGLDLFEYDPNAKFTVNLIYDERQRETLLRQRTESGFEQAETIFEGIDNAFTLIKNEYEDAAEQYKISEAQYESKKNQYEKEVEYWNKRGGAREPEYSELLADAESLNREASQLNVAAERLNELQAKLKVALERRNEAAIEYNRAVKSFNEKYGHGYEFDQAEYVSGGTRLLPFGSNTSGQVNIYQFSGKEDLVLALAHEFGHSLGMDHVENYQSIMYYQSNENSISTLRLSTEDIGEFKRVCKKGKTK